MTGVLLASIAAAVLFAVLYFPTLNTLSRSLVSPYPKADVAKRVAAALVDALLVMTAVFGYVTTGSMVFVFAGALYVVSRDSLGGRSVGKFWFGLRVIDLQTGLPCGAAGSITRNLLFLIPGANLAAIFLESATMVRDPQGHRLGDRIAQTQVVEGLGVSDLAAAFQRWWHDFIGQLDGTPRRRRRVQQHRGVIHGKTRPVL